MPANVLWLRVRLGIFGVLSTAACSEDIVAPESPAAKRPHFAVVGGQSDNFVFNLSGKSSNDTLAFEMDSLPYLTLLHATVSGTETAYWTEASNWMYAGQVQGVYDAGGFVWGWGSCSANVELSFGATAFGYCNATPPPLGAGPCTSPVPSFPGLIPIVTWHTHPFKPRSGTDSLPRSQVLCPSKQGYIPPLSVPRKLALGPSEHDFSANAGSPFIIVDKDNVYVVSNYDPTKKNTWKSKRFKRSSCDALAAL